MVLLALLRVLLVHLVRFRLLNGHRVRIDVVRVAPVVESGIDHCRCKLGGRPKVCALQHSMKVRIQMGEEDHLAICHRRGLP